LVIPEEFLRSIVRRLKSVTLPEKKIEFSADYFLELLEKILYDYNREGKEIIVIIDEAHVIEDTKVFEELRLLLNFQLQEKFLPTLLIFGQLSFEDTQQYIIHRLSVAGRATPIFTKEAIRLIYEYSGGVPRCINRLCDICLLAGFGKRVEMIDQVIVGEEIKGLS
jgi:type II secretory pathway predicted ATPase ExeA